MTLKKPHLSLESEWSSVFWGLELRVSGFGLGIFGIRHQLGFQAEQCTKIRRVSQTKCRKVLPVRQ